MAISGDRAPRKRHRDRGQIEEHMQESRAGNHEHNGRENDEQCGERVVANPRRRKTNKSSYGTEIGGSPALHSDGSASIPDDDEVDESVDLNQSEEFVRLDSGKYATEINEIIKGAQTRQRL